MLRQIFKRIRQPQTEQNSVGQEPYQNKTTANTSNQAVQLEWQPLDVSKLNITTNRLRQIEASLAEKTRAEFAAVTSELNRSQTKANEN